jgi:beta-lactam-binding protein with PASTA domain
MKGAIMNSSIATSCYKARFHSQSPEYLRYLPQDMGELFRFIFSKRFVKHSILASAVFILLIFILFAWMRSYTHHGAVQAVPELLGMDLREAEILIKNQGLRIVVEDSVYVAGIAPGSIVSQNPGHEFMTADSSGIQIRMVKKNRKIYTTVASYLPPRVEVPDLVGKSKRIALNLLEITGIIVDDMEYVPDNVCTDCVLKQLYKGKKIEPGTKLYKGEGITLVLGEKDARYVSIPKITGYTYSEAQNILNRVSLNMGKVVGGCEECHTARDTADAYVLKQFPNLGGSLDAGGSLDVYLTQDASLIEN